MNIWENIRQRFPIIDKGIEKLQEVSLPGFDRIPIYDVGMFFINEIKRDVITVRAKSIAFTYFLALIPSIIFIFTLIPYVPVDNLQENLLNVIRDLMPAESFEFIDQTITDIIKKQRGGLLSLGFFMTLFFATNGMMGIMESFDKSMVTFTKRNPFKQRLVALKLTVVIFVLLIVSMTLIVVGNQILIAILDRFHRLNSFNILLFTTLKYLVVLLLFFNAISFIYYYGPATKKKWRFISAGSTLATLLTILISIGFSYFVNNFGQYNKVYGSLGTIIALQIWLYLNSLALLIGFELNTSIAYNKNLRQQRKAEEEKEQEVSAN